MLTEKELLKYRTQIVKDYKDGLSLEELCRSFRLDSFSILFLLKKSKLKKKKLYIVYINQNDHKVEKSIFNEKERYYIQKFFPSSESSNLTGGYYWHWRENRKKIQNKKEKCSHDIRHIRCGRCNTILKDASNIPLSDAIIRKTSEKENVDI